MNENILFCTKKFNSFIYSRNSENGQRVNKIEKRFVLAVEETVAIKNLKLDKKDEIISNFQL